MARWRKVEVGTWSDTRFRRLSAPQPNAQTLWLYLLCGPRTTTFPGLIVAREAVMADDLGWPVEAFREAFREASAEGMAEADWKAGLTVLPRALLDSLDEPRGTARPESPNVLRSWAKSWDEVPDCPLKDKYLRALESFAEALGPSFLKAFREAFRRPLAKALAQPSPNQEKEKEKEQEKEKEERDAGTPATVTAATPVERPRRAPRLAAHEIAAREVWELQERLRAETIPGCRPLAPTADRLARIAKLLAGGTTPQECEDVLRAVADRVRRDPAQAEWFNGDTTWRPANFTRELGRIGAAGSPARPRAAARPADMSHDDLVAAAQALRERGL